MIPEDIPAFKTRLDHAFLAFFVVWVLWGIVAQVAFYRERSVEYRRRWHRRISVINGTVFFAFICYIVWLGFPMGVLFAFGPAVFAISAISIRNTRFCDACGKQNFTMNPFDPPAHCRKCGAAL